MMFWPMVAQPPPKREAVAPSRPTYEESDASTIRSEDDDLDDLDTTAQGQSSCLESVANCRRTISEGPSGFTHPARSDAAVLRQQTWGCPTIDREDWPPSPQSAEQRNLRKPGVWDSEAFWRDYEVQLAELESSALIFPAWAEAEARYGARECAKRVAEVHTACLTLSKQLEELAADALEAGCSRIAGAMDAFERANSGLERIATCLRACRETDSRIRRLEAEASAAAGLAPYEGGSCRDDEDRSGLSDAALAVAKALAIATAAESSSPTM